MEEPKEQFKNFIQEFIEEDLQDTSKLATRFPPEPNGHLHIGHAKSINLNYSLAKQYGGTFNLRFDDTNPAKESMEYVESIIEDVKWLGADYDDRLFFASDYFDKLFEYAIVLIKKELAFVCDLSPEEMQNYRGTFTESGVESPYRNRSIEENLKLFLEMKDGKYKDGEKTLRAKIDMTSPNISMRDPVIYRISHTNHYRTENKWCIYPMYDYAHPLEDAIEGITHSLCSIEFENNRPLYNWFVENVGFENKPRQIEFAKMQISNTIMGKRYLKKMVDDGLVSGWDDPRLPTIKGLRRRGYTAEIIKEFCNNTGISKSDSVIDISLLFHFARNTLKKQVPSIMAVIDPIKVVITNYPENEIQSLRIENNSEVDMGIRTVSFGKELYIESQDFMENPPKKFRRLSLGTEVRLKGAYFIKCNEVIKDENGKVIQLNCTYDALTLSGSGFNARKVKGTIHWVAAGAIESTLNFYENLTDENGNFNKESIRTVKALVETSIENFECNRFQFIRHGYFVKDNVNYTKDNPVYNCIVNLKSSY
ncbi:MAG: glutamine--tRNA ligase/YqeY domain fusion protein [Defluviitaleaceae bacterium]|nr:glutamine--tRNA ligase/YqeY domain fusion protein [Defluviitaleaceae bacterium]